MYCEGDRAPVQTERIVAFNNPGREDLNMGASPYTHATSHTQQTHPHAPSVLRFGDLGDGSPPLAEPPASKSLSGGSAGTQRTRESTHGLIADAAPHTHASALTC